MSTELDTLAELVRRGDVAQLRQQSQESTVRTLARLLRQLGREELLFTFAVVAEGRDGELFAVLDSEVRAELLSQLPRSRAVELFAKLDPDDRAWLCQRLPEELAQDLLAGLTPSARESTQRLMAYPAGSTGRAMNPHVVGLAADQSAASALDQVRQVSPETETVYMLPVLDPGGVVLGVVSLRRLVTSELTTPVSQLMTSPVVVVQAEQDQEEAARVVREAQLIAAPVVDAESRLVGVLTVDDTMRILAEADEEDAARGTSSQPLRRTYLVTSVRELMRARIGWLLVLIVAATLTVNVLDYFEDTLAQVVTLALFVPLLIGTGGNAGAQSATTVVRALAVGDVRPRDLPRVVLKELATGLCLGLTLAAAGLLPAVWFAGWSIAIVVCLSLVAICVLATAVGSITPLLARRAGIDPAVVSAPFISTIVDATGLVVYFLTAQIVLGIG